MGRMRRRVLPEQKNFMMASVPASVMSLLGYVTPSVSSTRLSDGGNMLICESCWVLICLPKLWRCPSSFGSLTSFWLFEISKVLRLARPDMVDGKSFKLFPEIFRVWRFFKDPILLGNCFSLLFWRYKAWRSEMWQIWLTNGTQFFIQGYFISVFVTFKLRREPISSGSFSMTLLRTSRTWSSQRVSRDDPDPLLSAESSLSWNGNDPN